MSDLFFPVWYNYPDSDQYVGGILDWAMVKELFHLRKFHGSLWLRYLFNMLAVTNLAVHFILSLTCIFKLPRLAFFIIVYFWLVNVPVVQVCIKVFVELATSVLLIPHTIQARLNACNQELSPITHKKIETKQDEYENPYDV